MSLNVQWVYFSGWNLSWGTLGFIACYYPNGFFSHRNTLIQHSFSTLRDKRDAGSDEEKEKKWKRDDVMREDKQVLSSVFRTGLTWCPFLFRTNKNRPVHIKCRPHKPRDGRLGGFHCPDTTILCEHSKKKTHLDHLQFNPNAVF